MISPPAGISYKNNGIWYWNGKPEIPVNHPNIGIAKTWRESIDLQGAGQMGILKKILFETSWWTMWPAPEMLVEQPEIDMQNCIGICKSDDSRTAVIITPIEQNLRLNIDNLQKPLDVIWVNSRTEDKVKVEFTSADDVKLRPPKSGDWLLILKTLNSDDET